MIVHHSYYRRDPVVTVQARAEKAERAADLLAADLTSLSARFAASEQALREAMDGWNIDADKLAVAERTVRKQREALERIAYLTLGDMEQVGVDLSDLDPAERASEAMERIARETLASLPPVADERTEP